MVDVPPPSVPNVNVRVVWLYATLSNAEFVADSISELIAVPKLAVMSAPTERVIVTVPLFEIEISVITPSSVPPPPPPAGKVTLCVRLASPPVRPMVTVNCCPFTARARELATPSCPVLATVICPLVPRSIVTFAPARIWRQNVVDGNVRGQRPHTVVNFGLVQHSKVCARRACVAQISQGSCDWRNAKVIDKRVYRRTEVGGDVRTNRTRDGYGTVVGHAEAVYHAVICSATTTGRQCDRLRDIRAYGPAKRYGQHLRIHRQCHRVNNAVRRVSVGHYAVQLGKERIGEGVGVSVGLSYAVLISGAV